MSGVGWSRVIYPPSREERERVTMLFRRKCQDSQATGSNFGGRRLG